MTSRPSDQAILRATEGLWEDWFEILDDHGAREHRDIVAFLADRHDLRPWWCEMIANEYQKHKGWR